jgi:ornithine carbamoyltransferase
MKHVLKLLDLTPGEIIAILNLADQLKYEQNHGIEHRHLKGKSLGMIFAKSSTRTRISFETGMYQLGGHALMLPTAGSQMSRGEPPEDTARVLSRYLDGVMIRTFDQEEVENFAKFGSIPVINGLTDFTHPCQVLADLMTIREHKGKLEGLKACFIGAGFNMANALTVGCLKVGMSIALAIPKGYEPDEQVLAFAEAYGDKFTLTADVKAAAADADVLITDVWSSMGQEDQAEQRKADFAGFQINDDLLAVAKPDVMIQHCLPAHKGEEITAEVFEDHAVEIFDEAENRLHAQKAVMVKLMAR